MALKMQAEERDLDEVKYEEERARLDSLAREQMKKQMEESMSEFSQLRNPWKWEIRQRVWGLMEEQDIAREPRPVFHRIPNFEGADRAAMQLCSLSEFKEAKVVKVNPDTPQKEVRYRTLMASKTLMTPQPRLRTGFFSILSLDTIPRDQVRQCCTSVGVAKYGKPLTTEDEIKVDLIVVGSTAVCPRTGARIGKGEGFAELEYGMLRMMGAIDDNTLVVTSVHDAQVVDDIPSEELLKHDVPVDIICTPTRIIRIENRRKKPEGIYWDLLSPEKLAQIKVLQQLKAKIEEETGTKLPTGPSEKLPPLAARSDAIRRGNRGRNNRGRGRGGRRGQA